MSAILARIAIPARQIVASVLLLVTVGSCDSKGSDPEPPAPKAIYYIPAWSPDGTEVACTIDRFDDSGGVKVFIAILDATTGAVRRERQLGPIIPFSLSWTPDGAWLLFSSGPGIFKMSSDLNTVFQLTSGQFHGWPSYSRLRNLVFFTQNEATKGGLFSVTVDGDSLQRWSTSESIILQAYAFPDSSDSLIGFDPMSSSARLMVFRPDSISHAHFLGIYSLGPFARISRDHRYIAYNAGVRVPSGNLMILDRSTDSIHSLDVSATEGMDFSPDGSRLIFPMFEGQIGLWILDLRSGERTLLTREEPH